MIEIVSTSSTLSMSSPNFCARRTRSALYSCSRTSDIWAGSKPRPSFWVAGGESCTAVAAAELPATHQFGLLDRRCRRVPAPPLLRTAPNARTADETSPTAVLLLLLLLVPLLLCRDVVDCWNAVVIGRMPHIPTYQTAARHTNEEARAWAAAPGAAAVERDILHDRSSTLARKQASTQARDASTLPCVLDRQLP